MAAIGGLKKFKMATVAKVQKIWHKNRSTLKNVLFVIKIFKMATNIKIRKIVKN